MKALLALKGYQIAQLTTSVVILVGTFAAATA